jgi:hypothetical protein
MAKYRQEQAGPGPHFCDCGALLRENETVATYPIPDEVLNEQGIDLREVVCMTCHFWFTHNVLEEMGH